MDNWTLKNSRLAYMPERTEPNREETRTRREQLLEKRRLVETLYTDYQEPGKEHVGVDAELKEGIAVFLAMGMQTDASCWGHPERRNDPNALEAEKNLVPYIDFSGYQPTDGLDDEGNAVGYTQQQVEAACQAMEKDAKTLAALIEEFYRATPFPEQAITLSYVDGMPGATLHTQGRAELAKADRVSQDRAIAAARKQWAAFLAYARERYFERG